MPVWSMNRFISAMPPKGVTGLSEYSMGRFTITVILASSSIPSSNKRFRSLPAFYCMIRVEMND
jgi:hypothetical protein